MDSKLFETKTASFNREDNYLIANCVETILCQIYRTAASLRTEVSASHCPHLRNVRKMIITFVLSVCTSVRPPVCPHGATRLPVDTSP